MSDRIAGYVVTMKHDARDDEIEATVQALQQIKGGVKVSPIVADTALLMATMRVRQEHAEELIGLARKWMAS